MILLKRKTIPSREKRLNTLNAYIGEAGMLLQRLQQDNEMRQWIRTFTQTTVDDVICALQLIGSLQNVGVVIHGPRGCSASQFYFDNSQHGRLRNGWAVTNLDEKDTIMGGENSLREAILTLHNRHHPDAIFVVATPVVAINNDDVSSVAIELQEELGIKVIPIYSDGFKSRTGITGYDAALHAVMRHLPMEQRKTQEKFVNLLAVAENRHNVDEIQRLIQALGLEVNILPQAYRPIHFLVLNKELKHGKKSPKLS
jgi:nitrogenase molybdenum-cofactor synthesis protein NifE